MTLKGIMLSEIHSHKKRANTVWSHLYKAVGVHKVQVAMLLEGEEMGSYYVMRKEFQSKMKRVLDMDGSDGCTTM